MISDDKKAILDMLISKGTTRPAAYAILNLTKEEKRSYGKILERRRRNVTLRATASGHKWRCPKCGGLTYLPTCKLCEVRHTV